MPTYRLSVYFKGIMLVTNWGFKKLSSKHTATNNDVFYKSRILKLLVQVIKNSRDLQTKLVTPTWSEEVVFKKLSFSCFGL